jgi:hypothetical protein
MLIPLLSGLFNDSKDPGYFAPQAGEFRSQNRSPGMQHNIDIVRQQSQVHPNRFAHTPLDAVALHCLAQNAPSSQPNARTNGRSRSPLGEKICHGAGKVLAAPLVHALVVSMLAEPSVVLYWKTHPITRISCRSFQV